MSEYIERGAKIEELKQWVKNNPHATEESKMKVAYGIQLLANIPAADVEPVVRCRDCEHSEEVDEESKTMFEGDPEFYCGHIDCPVDGNGFCSAGKRKAHMERSGSGE